MCLKGQNSEMNLIVILLLIIFFMGYIIFFLYNAFKQKDIEFKKLKKNFLMLYDWMDSSRTENKALVSLLEKRGYKEVIIYGWGYLGQQLYKELQDTQIRVKGILDRRTMDNAYNIPAYTLRSELPEADAVIITVLYDGEKIRNDLAEKVNCPIMSLEELI